MVTSHLKDLMRQILRVLLLALVMALNASSACRAQGSAQGGFWVAGEFGYGTATLDTNASSRSKGGFALGLEGGYAFNPVFSVGFRLNGCTLEASNLNDPAKGESLSMFSAMVRVYPWRGQGIFLRGGAGSLRYTNNRPLEFGGSGTGYFLGAGFEFPVSKRFRIAPVLDFTSGKLDDVDNALATIRDRRCKLVSFGISLKFS